MKSKKSSGAQVEQARRVQRILVLTATGRRRMMWSSTGGQVHLTLSEALAEQDLLDRKAASHE